MDEVLLGRAVEFHGPDFLRQLQLEQERVPPNIFLHLQKHRPQMPEINDPQFILNMRRFVSKKADILFRPMEKYDKSKSEQIADEDSYAKMPPLETFMGIDPHTARKHLYYSLQLKDVAVAMVTSILDTGLVLQLLCLDDDKNRDIDDLGITAFIHSAEIPKMFPTQNPVEGYQVKDFIRGVITNVNPESESILMSLMDTSLGEITAPKPTLGLIQEEDFPVQYRRKLHIRGLTFDELVNSIIGFTNPGNVRFLLETLGQKEEVSMMSGLYRLKISEKDYAENLRKSQSQKWAYQCVAQGIHDFKANRQTEAMQSFNKALQIDKVNVEALVARGALYANNESYTRALVDFEEALQINPKHPNAIKYMHETLLAKGKCHEDDKQFSDAKQCYQRAVEIMPDSAEAKEYLRYIEYKEERDSGKRTKIKKEQPPKERTPSPVPYKETTDTLKKLIKEEKKGSRSRNKDFSGEPSMRKRSVSPRKRHRSSSSSSSSPSGSSSSSRSSMSRQGDRSRGQRSQDKREAKSESKKERDDIQYAKSKSREPVIKPKEKIDEKRGKKSPIHSHSREDDFLYGRDQAKDVKQESSSSFFSFSRSNEKIPGLGESPPPEERSEIQHDELDSSSKQSVDEKSRQDDRESRYSLEERPYRRLHEGNMPSRRSREDRSPSLGREISYKPPEDGRGNYRRSIESENRRRYEEEKSQSLRDEEYLYGTSDPYEQDARKRQAYSKYDSSRNRSRSPRRDVMIGNTGGPAMARGRDSVTPTKDEVSDRLGLEDISSPEDVGQHGADYRFRGYGRRDDLHDRKYDKQGDSRYRDFGADRQRDDHMYKEQRNYSPERNRSPRNCSPKYWSPRRQDHSQRRASDRYGSPSDHISQFRHGSPPRQRSSHRRSMSPRCISPRQQEDEYRGSWNKIQGKEEYQERRIISMSKKEKTASGNSNNYEQKELRMRSPPRESDSRYYTDNYGNDNSQERRSIMIGKGEKQGRRRSPDYDRKESLDQKDSRWKKSFKQAQSRSPSPESRQSREEQYKNMPKEDYYEQKLSESNERRQILVRKKITSSRSRSRSPTIRQRHYESRRSRSGSPGRKKHFSYSRSKSRSPSRQKHTSRRSRSKSISRQKCYDNNRSRSNSPSRQKRETSRRSRSRNRDETYERVIALKPKKTNAQDKEATLDRNPSRDYERNSVKSNGEDLKPSNDIFADLPPPRANKDKQMISTYVPRAVKLKQQHPVGLNPESKPPSIEQKVEMVNLDTRNINIKSIGDVPSKSASTDNDPRFKFRPKSPENKRRSSKYKSRSRSRSRSKDKYKKSRKSRSRSYSPKSRSHKSYSRKSRSRSRSYDKYKSKKDYKRHKRSYSSSSSRSRSRSRGKSSSAKKTRKVSSPEKKIAANDLPKVSSRWDSPEEKKSRWGNTDSGPKLLPASQVSQAQEKMANMLAAHLISKSPPPHRRMKPEEKAALEKKWKELSVSPLPEDEVESDVPSIIRARAADFEKKILSAEKNKTNEKSKENPSKETKKESKAPVNIQKIMKMKGLRSKWDTDSDSEAEDKKSRSRSGERTSKSKKDSQVKRDRSDSSERSKSRSEKKKKRERSRSKDRKQSSKKKYKSRSRSKEKHSRRSRSESRDRKSSKDRKDSSKSRERKTSDRRRSSGKGLPDVVQSAKKDSDEQRVFWFHREEIEANEKKLKKRSRSRSPKSKKSPAKAREQLFKPTFKSKWSSDSDSSDEKSKEKSKDAKKESTLIPKDSLTQLEEFYNKLKMEKQRKLSGDKK